MLIYSENPQLCSPLRLMLCGLIEYNLMFEGFLAVCHIRLSQAGVILTTCYNLEKTISQKEWWRVQGEY